MRVLIDIGIFILGGSFGLILGCCLASASNEDEYLEENWRHKK